MKSHILSVEKSRAFNNTGSKLRIKGNWLLSAGFKPGDKVNVMNYTINGRPQLIINLIN